MTVGLSEHECEARLSFYFKRVTFPVVKLLYEMYMCYTPSPAISSSNQ